MQTKEDIGETIEFGVLLKLMWNSKYEQKIKKFGKPCKYTTLSHAEFENFDIRGKKFRDEDKNLIELQFPYLFIEAGVNKHGVGDGLKPDVARTWTISIGLHASRRDYRCKYFYSDEHLKYYKYNRNRKEALENLFYILDNHSQWKEYLTPNNKKIKQTF